MVMTERPKILNSAIYKIPGLLRALSHSARCGFPFLMPSKHLAYLHIQPMAPPRSGLSTLQPKGRVREELSGKGSLMMLLVLTSCARVNGRRSVAPRTQLWRSLSTSP